MTTRPRGPARRLLRPLAVLVLAAVVTGCGGGRETTDAGPAPVPDDLCPQVQRLLAPDLAVAETDHATERGTTRAEATCRARGRASDGEPLTLSVTVTTLAAEGDRTPRQRAEAEVERRCADLDDSRLGPVSLGEHDCEGMGPMTVGAVAGVYLLRGGGVLEIAMTVANPDEIGAGIGPAMSELAEALVRDGIRT